MSRPAADRSGARVLAAGCCTWCGHVHRLVEPCGSTGCECRRHTTRHAYGDTPPLY